MRLRSRLRVHSSVWPILVLLLGFALRVTNLTTDRFHADEALYAGWALSAMDGDCWLTDAPVDKPPLYLYVLAGSFASFGTSEAAARFPNLWASLVGIALVYRLGLRIYGRDVATWAAFALALSPFDILFARTAFTDPLLSTWMLASLGSAASRRWFLSGLFLGLGFATKQTALLLGPLVICAGLLIASPDRRLQRSRGQNGWLKLIAELALGFAIPFVGVVAWDSVRWPSRPGYWEQSALSYGGMVWAPGQEWGQRYLEWLSWARYLSGSPFLAGATVAGSIALLAYGWATRSHWQETWLDTLWAVFLVVYLLMHSALRFSIWDRYLLPLAPLVALLLARVLVTLSQESRRLLWQPERAMRPVRLRFLCPSLASVAVVLTMGLALVAGIRAAQNGYPIGGEHWAYQGLDEIADYLKAEAPHDAVLYHHWLRWHYSYYLYGTSYEQRWWESGEHLQREALRTPDRVQYLVLPDWRDLDPEAPGLKFELLYQARRRDDSISLSLYRIYPRLMGSQLPEAA